MSIPRKILYSLFIIGLVVSLWFNYNYLRQHHRADEWKHFSYNNFVVEIYDGGRYLGYTSLAKNPNRAALSIGEAAMALEQLAAYEDLTHSHTTPEMHNQYSYQNPPHLEDVEHYLSYVALVISDPKAQLKQGDEKEAEKYVINVAKLMKHELAKKGALSNIPDKKEKMIFEKMYQLIPKTFKESPAANMFNMP